MSFINITEPSEIPQEGNVAVFILVDSRAPCKKFLNYAAQAVSILEPECNPTNGTYLVLNWNDVVKEEFTLGGMPTCIVFVDGVEKKRFVGHFYSQFEIAGLIAEGFNK